MLDIEDTEIPKKSTDEGKRAKRLASKKTYWEKNKDRINEKRRSPEYIEKQKQYRESKKEEINAKQREKQRNSEKVYCDICQFHVQKISLARHNSLNPNRGCHIDPEIEEKYSHFAEKLRREHRESQKKFYEEKEREENEKRLLEKKD